VSDKDGQVESKGKVLIRSSISKFFVNRLMIRKAKEWYSLQRIQTTPCSGASRRTRAREYDTYV